MSFHGGIIRHVCHFFNLQTNDPILIDGFILSMFIVQMKEWFGTSLVTKNCEYW